MSNRIKAWTLFLTALAAGLTVKELLGTWWTVAGLVVAAVALEVQRRRAVRKAGEQ